MKILIVGGSENMDECRQKFPDKTLEHAESHGEAERYLHDTDVVFDFIIDKHPESFSLYSKKSLTVFLNTCMITLAELTCQHTTFKCSPIGFNGFPTLFSRECLEVAILNSQDISHVERICNALQTQYMLVDDRVGLVTPRIICMIINEAFFTVEEGTASREDIDLAMKLGTNYPYGPFEWCERIGLDNIYPLLKALYHDTKDQRYKTSALMKKEFMRRVSGRI
jgi:3-hydroxybutyryl-CoA dehydrogenase